MLLIFTARHYASAVYAVIMCLSVCLSVCHTPVLYQNGSTYDHTNNATQLPRDSSFLTPKFEAKFERDHPLWGRQMQVGWVKIDHLCMYTEQVR